MTQPQERGGDGGNEEEIARAARIHALRVEQVRLLQEERETAARLADATRWKNEMKAKLDLAMIQAERSRRRHDDQGDCE